MIGRFAVASLFVLASATGAQAGSTKSTIAKVDATGIGDALGVVALRDTKQGLLIEPRLAGLPPGAHGFHVHEKGACGPGEQNGQKVAGMAAGGHYDPQHTGKHLGPDSTEGHKGDLPVLVVDKDGKATLPVLAPHLTVKDVRGRTLMIHAGGDNYSDEPAPLGGGGARIACGVIK